MCRHAWLASCHLPLSLAHKASNLEGLLLYVFVSLFLNKALNMLLRLVSNSQFPAPASQVASTIDVHLAKLMCCGIFHSTVKLQDCANEINLGSGVRASY